MTKGGSRTDARAASLYVGLRTDMVDDAVRSCFDIS